MVKRLKIDPNADLSKLYDEVREIQSIVNGINNSNNSFAAFSLFSKCHCSI